MVRWKECLRMKRCKHILTATEDKYDKWVGMACLPTEIWNGNFLIRRNITTCRTGSVVLRYFLFTNVSSFISDLTRLLLCGLPRLSFSCKTIHCEYTECFRNVYILFIRVQKPQIWFEVSKAAKRYIAVFRAMTLCSLVGGYQRFSRIYCIHSQDLFWQARFIFIQVDSEPCPLRPVSSSPLLSS
jgi:hypothetical protein